MIGNLRIRLLAGAMMVAAPGAALASGVSGSVTETTGARVLEGALVTLVVRYVGAPPETIRIAVPDDGMLRRDVVLGDPGQGEIRVIGQQANIASALSRQRAADGVESVLTRDSIGQFPDQNVAEAVRRAPGINVLDDQGEGRFVAVRGLDPSLNSATKRPSG